jgi:membrane protein YqaA with SNARE-associated domain
MRVFADEYPLFLVALIATIATVLATFANWWLGQIAVFLSKNPLNTDTIEPLNSQLIKKASVFNKIKTYWLAFGHWGFLIVAVAPPLGQIIAVLSGWIGVKPKDFIFPTLIGSSSYFIFLAFILPWHL